MLIATRTAKITRNAAIKIVVYIVVRPKKSRCRPKTSMSIPIIIQLSLNTLHRLDTSKTGQPYFDLPQILIYFSVVSYFTSTKLWSYEHYILYTVCLFSPPEVSSCLSSVACKYSRFPQLSSRMYRAEKR